MPANVLIVTTDSKICGTERMILSLLRHVDRNQFTPYVVSLTGPGDLIEAAREWGVEGTNLQFSKQQPLQSFKRWRYEVRRFNPHIIHSFLFHSNLLARITRLYRRRTAVISGLRTVYSVQAYGALYGRLERWTHCLDNFYIANSQLGFESAVSVMRLPPQKLVVIRNGIEVETAKHPPERVRREVREEFGFADEQVVAGVVAQLRPAKRHDILLNAAAKLRASFPQLKILIVGEGERMSALRERAAQLGIAEHVVFCGFRSDVARLLLGMDLFALPSQVEGQPVSILEAMRAGLPVVAVRAGGIPEIVEEGQTALLAEPNDEAAFVNRLQSLLDSPEKRLAMGRAGQERVKTHFSAEQMARQFEACYAACLK